MSLLAGDRREMVEAGWVASNFFQVLGVKPFIGRGSRPRTIDRKAAPLWSCWRKPEKAAEWTKALRGRRR